MANSSVSTTDYSRQAALSPVERLLSVCAPVRGGEGSAVALMLANAFLLLFAYYLLKPVREALILTGGGAELRSYAMAAQALVLMVLLPLYARLARGRDRAALVRGVNIFFAVNLLAFFVLGRLGVPVGLAFFIWLGVFSVAVVSQFWVFAAELFRVESGQRLFAVIMLGASMGALAGSRAAGLLDGVLGPWNLMLLAGGLLVVATSLGLGAAARVPGEARRPASGIAEGCLTDGLRFVLTDSYVRLIALFVVLLNCVNTTGEYILAKWVLAHADRLADGTAAGRAAVIGDFYASFYGWVSVLNLAAQALLVSRVIRRVGVGGALIAGPVLAAAGYALVAFAPLLGLVAVFKLLENSLDYSLQNTARQALFLPTSRAVRCLGKTAVDTVFWRLGDLLQAALVFAGAAWLGLGVRHFSLFNAAMALAWVAVAVALGRAYRARANTEINT